MTTAEKSMKVVNQMAVTVPPNSEKIIMVRIEAVSYTHLDVYKRQANMY